ncbi:DUF3131 domain-containing protein [Parasedimentitalea marina]|uniref:DUF3131 domain-containing protein n=1 Tax=Parasedimentitalea marina TaxID=2483033 RepID=A0A3T0MZF0_9RHOB|nr:DUF3131 domain-containing protein [Parasedimentitalea marina]AZV77143.1 DUF3131 domain-containing protein [Parasedimentitalea marina]
MKRRAFLQGSVASFGALAFPFSRAASASGRGLAMVVVDDIDMSSSLPHLIALLDALNARLIPVTCCISPYHENGSPIDLDTPLAQLILAYMLGNRGVEVAAFVPELSRQSEYFQGRSVQKAIKVFREILQPAKGARQYTPLVQSVACLDVTSPLSPTGVRSGGCHNVLAIPTVDGPVRSETWPDGTVRLFGGRRIDFGAYDSSMVEKGAEESQLIYYLSAQKLETLSVEELAKVAKRFTDDLVAQEIEGNYSVQPLSDLQFRDSYGFTRRVVLQLLDPAPLGSTGGRAMAEFATLLDDLNLPHTLGLAEAEGTREQKSGFWLSTEDVPSLNMVRFQSGIANQPSVVETVRPLGAGVGVVFDPVEEGQGGLDENGYLHLVKVDIRNANDIRHLGNMFSRTQDVVLTVHASAVQDPFDRQDLLAFLKTLSGDGVSRIVPLSKLAMGLVSKDPIDIRQRRTLAALPSLRQVPIVRSRADKDALLEDARTAWRYFERFTHPQTGLCPATVNFAPGGGNIHKAVTMWDVGSQINGLISAARIGLIDQKEFRQAITKLLPQIRGRVSQDRLLPQGWIVTDRHKWGNKNFDGSDAGRLMSALDCLRRYDDSFAVQLDKITSAWDLDKVILNGEMHSVTDGVLHSSYVSHSAHYSALAFRRWGLTVKSPYEFSAGQSVHDSQMGLLEAVAKIGPIGAEPLLLEAMELGMSPESKHLADMLFTAQFEEFQETGQLVCVSEGPLDVEPWFSYQGLQLDAQKRTWAIDTVGQETEYRQPEFWRSHHVISCKAAFLWGAYRPHNYSDRLVNYVRTRARTKNGFAASIFSQSQRATEYYTDINTNAVILQAVAHSLGAD